MASTTTRYRPRHRDVIMSGRRVPEGGPGGYVDRAKAAMAQAFKGITTDGEIVPGLFSIQKTGVSTKPIREAARAFLGSLTPEQRAGTALSIDSDEIRSWSNIHVRLFRHGVMVEEMSAAQKDAAYGVLKASLSAAGYELARNVMNLNGTIAEITNNFESYGDELYWLAIFGEPSETDPWGWQIDGHHLNITCFVLGDQVVMAPSFMGGEPCFADIGKYAGTRIFEPEETKGLELMRSLSAEQQAKAHVGDELPFEGFAPAFHDNYTQEQKGIRYSELTPAQQKALLELAELYIGRTRDDQATVKMSEVKAHLDDTYFAWIGGWGETDAFYYQIFSPVVLIEFDHQPGVALDSDVPSRDHIHTIIRTPNGGDYGKDLLRQHYEQHHHH